MPLTYDIEYHCLLIFIFCVIFTLLVGFIPFISHILLFLCVSGNFWLDARHCYFSFLIAQYLCIHLNTKLCISELCFGMQLKYLETVWFIWIFILIHIRRDDDSVYSRANFFPLWRQNAVSTIPDAHELEGSHSGQEKLELAVLALGISHSFLGNPFTQFFAWLWIVFSHTWGETSRGTFCRYL